MKDNLEAWGTLAPEDLPVLRRQQDLGLAAAVRHFNDRAVPGLGGLWFPMPLVWSVLAVSIANQLKRSALPVGNAIEALMMHSHRDIRNGRLRGGRKLQGMEDRSFANLTRSGVYVVQPIRMAMVQPLVALGFVQGSRYGAFRIDVAGERLLALPVVAGWRAALESWARGSAPGRTLQGLSPLAPLPKDIRKLIEARLINGHGASDEGAARRRALIDHGKGPSADDLQAADAPPGLAAEHWRDMRAGAAFIDLRDAALQVLRGVEDELLRMRDANTPLRLTLTDAKRVVGPQIDTLRQRAGQLSDRILAAGEVHSGVFVKECHNPNSEALLQRLAERDMSVIALRDAALVPGPAASDLRSNTAPAEGDVAPNQADLEFAPQLFRLRYLHYLTEELRGRKNPGSPDYPLAGGV
jgi:hypothetical protein